MNQGFKLRYDQMRDGDPTGTQSDNSDIVKPDTYQDTGHVRNLCLCWLNGRRMFFNYAYLVTGEFELADQMNLIKLGFSSHTVTLQGYGLESLFQSLLDHLPRVITATDPRYAQIIEHEKEVITIMIVEKNT